MAEPLQMPEAQLYTVTELARELGVTPRALRFYEDKGLLAPKRAGTTRIYTQRDRARMTLILRGKRLGFPLRDIREYLELYDAGDGGRAQNAKLREKLQHRLDQLRAQRRAIDEAIAELRAIEGQAREALR
jgi:DNA-binding transcriptional MerR regulator